MSAPWIVREPLHQHIKTIDEIRASLHRLEETAPTEVHAHISTACGYLKLAAATIEQFAPPAQSPPIDVAFRIVK